MCVQFHRTRCSQLHPGRLGPTRLLPPPALPPLNPLDYMAFTAPMPQLLRPPGAPLRRPGSFRASLRMLLAPRRSPGFSARHGGSPAGACRRPVRTSPAARCAQRPCRAAGEEGGTRRRTAGRGCRRRAGMLRRVRLPLSRSFPPLCVSSLSCCATCCTCKVSPLQIRSLNLNCISSKM